MHVVNPRTFARYKKETRTSAMCWSMRQIAMKNPIFTGAAGFTVNGILFHTSNKVYNTAGATTKWGSGNAMDGSRSLLLANRQCSWQTFGVLATGAREPSTLAPRTLSPTRSIPAS